MGDDWDDDVPTQKTSYGSNNNNYSKKPADDGWGAKSSSDGWNDKPAESTNDGWDDAPKANGLRKTTDDWDDEPQSSDNQKSNIRKCNSSTDDWNDPPQAKKQRTNDGWDAPSSGNTGWGADSSNTRSGGGGYGGGGGGGRGPRKPDWICNSCSATVFGSRDSCFKCQEPKGDAKDAPPRADGDSGRPRRANDWICDGCGAKVFGSKDTCFKCQEPKGNSKDAPPDDGSRPRGRASDWICDGCGAKVFGSKDTCFKCQAPKGDSKDAPAEGGGDDWGNSRSEGREPRGKKPGDWECNCGHSNFASRDKCQKCDESKPPSSGDDPQFNGAVVKEFYIPEETPEEDLFTNRVESGINFNKYENIPVKVNDPSRNDVPKAIQSFADAKLSNLLMENIQKSGYKVPTPIQKYGIPIIQAKRDLMACAQTGSGKTAAFLLPMINDLITRQASASIGSPKVVIVSPTRELAIQIYDEARKFTNSSIIKCGIVYGGTATRHQASQISHGCHIMVATPGRLLDFCDKTYISFGELEYLVLDEADRMLDMGFKDAVAKILNHPTIDKSLHRQTLMFSATFPKDIQLLAGNYLKEYIFLTVGIVGGACSDVTQTVLPTTRFEKRAKLMEILDGSDPTGTIVFVETQRTADFLASFLSESKHPTTSIHGARKQGQREQALSDFRRGRMKVMIATSVAARGLDIPNVCHVVNYDIPKSIDDYVHRIGRTGRLGNKGKATSFYDAEQDGDIASSLIGILKDANQTVPDFLSSGGGDGGGGGGYSGGGKNFGGSDFRQTSAPQAHGGDADDEEW